MEPIATSILALMYFGDVVFSVSGALTASRQRMDIVGFIMIGTITGIGGGTLRDLLLGRTVWWTQQPMELLLCIAAATLTYFAIPESLSRHRLLTWCDALGLSAFCVVGCHIALGAGVPPVVAVFMGMVTATGGGVIRDIICNDRPMITSGNLYATAALCGGLCYALLSTLPLPVVLAQVVSFAACMALRSAAIVFDIRMGPPGQFIRLGGSARSGDERDDPPREP